MLKVLESEEVVEDSSEDIDNDVEDVVDIVAAEDVVDIVAAEDVVDIGDFEDVVDWSTLVLLSTSSVWNTSSLTSSSSTMLVDTSSRLGVRV